ncbi:tyrosine-type recombinase/integrase [Lederbergia wuyishanensis]|uniref:tyrosine-type recombinase/integrase n=1 Tax=Lederbergia wuyishanensis TaxID=1347903 RepID=UPI0035E7F585
MSHSGILQAFRLLLNQKELNDVKKIRFHDLRHTHVSLLFSQNIHPKIVQERLDHSTIQMTLGTHTPICSMQEAAAQKLDEIFTNNETKDNKNTNQNSI